MNGPQNASKQLVTAAGFNAAWGLVRSSLANAINSLANPGWMTPAAITYAQSGLVLTVTFGSEAGLLSPTAIARAHGGTNNIDTQTYVLNAAPFVPGAGLLGAQSIYFYGTPCQIQLSPYTVIGPQAGHPSYDPNFQPYTAYAQLVDSFTLSVGTTVPAGSYELARATVSHGSTVLSNFTTSYQILAGLTTGIPPGTYYGDTMTIGPNGFLNALSHSFPIPVGTYPIDQVTVNSQGFITGFNRTRGAGVSGTVPLDTVTIDGAGFIIGTSRSHATSPTGVYTVDTLKVDAQGFLVGAGRYRGSGNQGTFQSGNVQIDDQGFIVKVQGINYTPFGYTTPGAYVLTIPAGVYAVEFDVWGGGGGGGGCTPHNQGQGGGGGAYAFVRVNCNPGDTFGIYVGAGGGGGGGGAIGNAGAVSSVYANSTSTYLAIASGGAGGAPNTTAATNGVGGNANGHIAISGGQGDVFPLSAGLSTTYTGVGGPGGLSPRGGQGGHVTANANGAFGYAPGGGGGGGGDSTGSAHTGGPGANGWVLGRFCG